MSSFTNFNAESGSYGSCVGASLQCSAVDSSCQPPHVHNLLLGIDASKCVEPSQRSQVDDDEGKVINVLGEARDFLRFCQCVDDVMHVTYRIFEVER